MNEKDAVTQGGRSAVMGAVEAAIRRRVDAQFQEWTRSKVEPTRQRPRCSRCGAWVAARPRWKTELEDLPTVEFGPTPTVEGDRPTDRP